MKLRDGAKIEYTFEHQWGGEDTWYTKSKRWANKQKFPINHLALGFIEWLREKWVDGKVDLEMASVDKQTEEIVTQWEKDERKPIVEERVSDVEGLPTLRISAPFVDRGSEVPESSMGTGSNEKGVDTKVRKRAPLTPDPWDYSGDWNDAALGFYYESRTNSRNVEKGQSD